MNKLKNKKILIPIVVIILILIIIAVFFLLKPKEENYEEKLKGYMEEMGREFYEELYYPKIENGDDSKRKEMLREYEEVGFKITLESLTRYETEQNKDKVGAFINPDTKKECDKKSSIVTINPKSPFGSKDYEISVVLVCGFDAN